MKQYLLVLFLIVNVSMLWGQNLVLNPGFETTSGCPIGPGQFNLATNWTDANASADSCSSPDLIAGCSPQFGGVNSPNMLIGYQQSRTGNHHAGLILYEAFPLFSVCIADDYREYIGGQLSAPMTAGQSYCVSFYISKANEAQWATDKIGVFFSNTPVNYPFPCPNGGVMAATPQLTYSGPALTDTLNWVLLQWNYVATGGEQYFAIGNYETTANTQASIVGTCTFAIHPYAYYFIDDVSVVAGTCCNLNISGVTTNVSCGTLNTGAINISIANGTAPFNYIWSNGATTEDLSGLSTGTYTVTATDALGCVSSFSATVGSSNGITVTGVVTDINCGGANNGAIDISPANGAAPYSFIWSNAATTEDISGLAAGSYTVTVSDASSCSTTYSTTVTSTPGLSITPNGTNITCNGLTNGVAAVIVNGGTTPYTYSWTTSATTASITGLAAGTYTVTVTDSGGGPPTLDTLYSEAFEGAHNWTLNVVTGANGANANIWTVSDDEGGVLPPGCGVATNGNKTLHMTATSIDFGFACFAVSGLGAAYNASGNSCGAGGCCVITNKRAESPVFTTVGYNNVSVSFDYIGNGEALDDNASMYYNDGGGWTLLVPSLKSAVCGGGQGQWTAFNIVLPASCFNNSNVRIAFNWTNDGDNVGTDPSFAMNNIVVTGMGGGSGGACSGIQSVTITNPSAIVLNNTTIPATCAAANGSINLTPSGGTPAYTFMWSNAATTEDLTGLNAGSYVVTVTDNNACTSASTITVGSAGALVVDVDTVINLTCNGVNTGEIQITSSDSSGCSSSTIQLNEIMYQPGASNGVDPNTGEYIELIGPPGANIGCYVLTDGDWTITIPPGTTIPADGFYTIGNNVVWGPGFFDLDAENCACFTEGTGGSSLLILTDGGEYVAMFNAAGTFVDGLIYGTPTVGTNDPPNGGNTVGGVINTVGTVGCVSSVTIPGPASFQTAAAVAAANTSLIRSPNGSGPWTSEVGGSANACNAAASPSLTYIWSNGATTEDVSGLSAGSYSVTVSNGGGCIVAQSFTVTEPSAITLTNITTVPNCAAVDGTVDLSVSGGTAGYSFFWSNGATTEDLTGLAAGTYVVTVMDANSCAGIDSAIVQNNAVVAVTASVTSASCNTSDGVIDLTASNGTTPYTFIWNTGATTEDLSALAAGNYSVTTTDAAGCSNVLNLTVGSLGASNVAVDTVINLSCNGANTGEILITVSGTAPCSSPLVLINELMYRPDTMDGNSGNPLITGEYLELIGPPGTNIGCYILTDGDWSITIPPGTLIPADGIFTLGHNSSPHAIAHGITYDLDVANCGCFVTATAGNGLLIFTNGGEYVALFDNTGTFIDGLLYGTPSAGNTPPSGATAVAGVMPTVGTGGCVSSVTIPGAASFQTAAAGAAPGTSLIRSPDGSNTWIEQVGGSPNACNTAGVPNFTYIWSNGATSEDVTGLAAGTYTVTVSNGTGCDAIQSLSVTEPSAITVTTDAINDATCTSAGSVLISATGGTAGYTFLWSNGATTEDISGLSAGTYNVTVTDANGCQMPGASYTVNSVGVPVIAVDNTTNPGCFGGTTGSIAVSVSNGVPGYTFAWSNGQTNATATGLGAGVYVVTVTDNNACTTSQSITITEPTQLVASVATSNATCVNNDASATLTINGGTGTYTFQWSTGAITQNVTGLAGPSNVSVTITDANGCTISSVGNPIGLDTTLTLTATSNNLDCSGDSTGAIALIPANGGLPFSYLWSNGETTDNLSGLGIGTYSVTVTDASGCVVSDSYLVSTPLLPSVNAFIGQIGVIDSMILIGESININAGNDQTTQGVTYQWTANPGDAGFGNAFIPSTTVSPGSEGNYTFTVIATSTDGCSDTSAVSLTVEGLNDPQIPTAFTPNGDDNNEKFYVINLNPEDIIDFKVFDRWGNLVFDNADNSGKWDGKMNGKVLSPDVYVYIISYQRSIDTTAITIRGQVTLLR